MEEEHGISSRGSNDYDSDNGAEIASMNQQETVKEEERSLEEIMLERFGKELKEMDMKRCEQEGEVLKKMLLEDDNFTRNEKKLLQKTHDQWKFYERILKQWTRFAAEVSKLNSSKITDAEWTALWESHEQFLLQIGTDGKTLKGKLKMVWEPFDKVMNQTKAMLSLRGGGRRSERDDQESSSEYQVVKKSHELEMEKTIRLRENFGILLQRKTKYTNDEKKALQKAHDQCGFYVEMLAAEVSRLSQQEQKLANAVSDDEKKKLLLDDKTCKNKLEMFKGSLKKLMNETKKTFRINSKRK